MAGTVCVAVWIKTYELSSQHETRNAEDMAKNYRPHIGTLLFDLFLVSTIIPGLLFDHKCLQINHSYLLQ